MKKIIMACLVIWQGLAFNAVQAQANGKISGQVLGADNKGMEAVTAILMRASDSSIVKTALTDADGYFSFEGLLRNTYRLQLTMAGYEMYSRDIVLEEQSISLTPVQLKKQEKTLDAVTVTARKPFVEKKIDRTVINVDALISNAGTTALEVLEKSPGVLVDQNGTISLKGKQGVMVFIDDKPTYLSAADLQNYLRSLPSSAPEQIELMPNPPAKYDAAGTGGVINIRTKKK